MSLGCDILKRQVTEEFLWTSPLYYMIENSLIRKSTYLIGGLVAVIAACYLWMVIAPHARAQDSQGTDEHLVTIHDRGKEKSVISKKDTLREVLQEAGIVLDKNDIVEPKLSATLVAPSYQVNIYRARPVVIQDGTNKLLVMSAHQTPKLIASNAGVTLHDEDKVTLQLSDNFIRDGASTLLKIDRAATVKLVLYGKHETVYTQSRTVGEFLKEKKITLSGSDTVSQPVSASVVSGMSLEIWRNGKQTVTQDEPVQFETEQIKDANQPVGYKKVQTPGKLGKKTVTYEVEMKNGQEVARKEIQSVVIEQPAKQTEVVGAKAESFGGTCGEWMAAAGITDTGNASYLIGKESGCNPYAVNRSSGACGVGQALPCSKTGCAMGDGQCQTIWMNKYVMSRYGSWQAAADHHRSRGWY